MTSLLDHLAGPPIAWTPTLSTQTPGGTPPVYGATDCVYYKLGSNFVLAFLDIVVTSPGTGTGFVQATLPAGMTTAKNVAAFGIERGNSGKGLAGEVLNGNIRFRYSDGLNPNSAGARLLVTALFAIA